MPLVHFQTQQVVEQVIQQRGNKQMVQKKGNKVKIAQTWLLFNLVQTVFEVGVNAFIRENN